MGDKSVEIISAFWGLDTEKRCNGYIKSFIELFHKQQTDPLCTTTQKDIEFLTEYFNTGMGRNAVNMPAQPYLFS